MDLFDFYTWSQRKLVFHGSAVEIACACEELLPQIDHLLNPFREVDFPEGFVPLRGTIEPFDLEDVLIHLSHRAKPIPTPEYAFELFRDGDRYYRLEESVGLTMVDLVRRRWHCWLTQEALLGDPVRLTDAAVLWPLSQLTGQRELHLVPAVAAARDGFGVLMLGDLPLEPEMSALIAAGYKLIGQRWVALREEENGRIAMLHLPGHVLQKPTPRAPQDRSRIHTPSDRQNGRGKMMKTLPRSTSVSPVSKHCDTGETPVLHGDRSPASDIATDRWIDLHAQHANSSQNHAYCDLILVCGPGRREQILVKQVGWAAAMNVLRRVWPNVDIPPGRRGGKLVSKMASRVRVAEMQLSRDPGELLKAIDLFRRTPNPSHLKPVKVPAGSMLLTSWTKPPAYRPMNPAMNPPMNPVKKSA